LQLEKATVQAPISGVINKEYVEAGDFVNIGSPLCEIIQTDRMKMVVGVPEKDVVYLSEGQEVPVQMDALTARGEKPLNGKISKIIPAADDVTHTFSVEIEINEPGPLARPGMIGRAELTRRKIHDAILIPIFAITRHSEGYAVFVEENGVAKRRIITMGSFLTQGIQVDEGLKAGDNLIIRGQRDLVDGEKVEVAKRISGDAFDLAAAMLGRITTNDIERFIDEYIDNAPNAETNNVEQNQ
jgi:membrane fusion protein (multidrug efflux system)